MARTSHLTQGVMLWALLERFRSRIRFRFVW